MTNFSDVKPIEAQIPKLSRWTVLKAFWRRFARRFRDYTEETGKTDTSSHKDIL